MNIKYFADTGYNTNFVTKDLSPKEAPTPVVKPKNPFTPEETLKVCLEDVLRETERYSALEKEWTEKAKSYIKKTQPHTITKYAIIDHVGSLTSQENKKIYKAVYAQAKAEDISAYTLRKVCKADSPFAREITSKMKFRARYTKNPQKVYLICDSLDTSAEFVKNIWEERNITVEVFEVNGFIESHQIDLDGKASINRRLAEIWGPAFGYSFSAPVTRIQNENNIENFSERSERKQLRMNPELATVDINETHFTKPFTSAEMFLEMTRCIAPDSEIKEFRQYLDAYLSIVGGRIDTRLGSSFGAFIGNASALQEFLNPDYTICPHCKRPTNLRNHKDQYGKEHNNPVCIHCDTEIDILNIPTDTYYEDSSDIDE